MAKNDIIMFMAGFSDSTRIRSVQKRIIRVWPWRSSLYIPVRRSESVVDLKCLQRNRLRCSLPPRQDHNFLEK